MADEEKLQRYLRKATAELQQTRGRLAAEEAKNREPVAIIGIGCRFPGGVRSPEDLWRLVDGAEDVISGLPDNRGWNLAGAMPGLRGGFLHDADRFDAEFFGMDRAEALATDPQQRLLLETSWEAFERAGIDPVSARETRTAVYAGLQFAGYPLLLREPPGPDVQDYIGFGNSVGAGSGRIAYLMGLLGAAVTVDTQCTSSLVAVHLACKALRNNECTLALAGGAAVMSLPTLLLEFRRTGRLSSDGRSRSFAAAADGVSLSEGAGMLLLERLSDARRNGHPVLAVIRGSAINQDGATNGMSAPRGQAQQRVIRQALADARLSAGSVDVVEGHGVGAVLGDGVEASSVITIYGSEHSPERPVLLGSVKSNIGHTQTVGAIAGITKLVMALQHERVPATLHVDAPTPHADWSAGTVTLATEPCAWPAGERVRRAAVSCLTLSGTNAHLILEEPPAEDAEERLPSPSAPVAWPLSARTPTALRELAARLREMVADADLRDIAAALSRDRPSFRHRAVLVGGDRGELLAHLDGLVSDRGGDGVAQGSADPRGLTALLFTGEAPPRPGVARGLYEAFPLFARELDEVCEQLDGSVRAALLDADRPYVSLSSARLAGFALQLALHRLVAAFGVEPRYMTGLGLGEVAAAHAAGALSLADSCALAVILEQETGEAATADLASVWIQAREDELRHEPELTGGNAIVAAVDEPGATVITGRPDAVAGLAERWRAQGRSVLTLKAARVVHPADTEPLASAALRRTVAGLSPTEPQVPLVSGSDGQAMSLECLRDAVFWAGRIRLPGRFLDAARRLLAHEVTRFVDLGAEAALAPLAGRAATGFGDPGRTILPVSLLAGVDGPGGAARALLSALAALYTDGVPVDWKLALEGHSARRVDLPTYPFQRRRHWLLPPDGAVPQPPPQTSAHPLLGTPIDLATGGDRWFGGSIADGAPASAALPRVHGTALLSPAALIDWALAAAHHSRASQDAPHTLREVRLHGVPELLGDGGSLALQTVREQRNDGERIRGFIRAGEAWRPSFTALVGGPDAEPGGIAGRALQGTAARPEEYSAEQWRRQLWQLGVQDDTAAGRVTALYATAGYAEAVMERAGTGAAGPWQLSPVLLEAAFRITTLAADDAAPGLRTVRSIDRLTVHGPLPGTVRVRAYGCEDGSVTLKLTSGQDEPLLVAEGLRLRPAGEEEPPTAAVELRSHELRWQPVPGPLRTAVPGARDGSWLIHSADAALAGRWREQLALAGVPAFALAPAGELADVEDGVLALDTGAEEPFEQVCKELARRGTAVAGLLLHDDGTAGQGFSVVRGFLRSCATERRALVVCSTAGSGTPDPYGGLIAALARTAAWEHSELSCVSVTLDAADALPDAGEVLGRAAQLAGSGRLSLRGGRWYEGRLREQTLADGGCSKRTAGPAIRQDAAYLVVGEGPEAVAAASWLAARGAGSVWRTADDPAEVAAMLAGDGPTVRGIVHLPAPAPELPLAGWDPARFERALEQAVVVPRLLQQQAGELDFLILCSPLATLPGRAGTAVATAAAEYADALARHRRAAGLATVSVAHGPWWEADRDGVAELATWGLHPAPVAAVLDAVSGVLTGSGAHAAPARADWRRYRAAAPRAVPYIPLEASAADSGKHTVGFGQGNKNSD